MKGIKIKTSSTVDSVFNNYPSHVKKKIKGLRKLILETANELNEIVEIEETLKWGEPSYLTKNGSTIRIDWKKNKPEQYAVYFSCTSRLVPTFKMLFPNVFEFEGKRAIIFKMDEKIPKTELKICIASALRYHKVKNSPTLGI